jgi:hypothetical protein
LAFRALSILGDEDGLLRSWKGGGKKTGFCVRGREAILAGLREVILSAVANLSPVAVASKLESLLQLT